MGTSFSHEHSFLSCRSVSKPTTLRSPSPTRTGACAHPLNKTLMSHHYHTVFARSDVSERPTLFPLPSAHNPLVDHVHRYRVAGVTETGDGCRGVCETTADCKSYTWDARGAQPSSGGTCYLRNDSLWWPNVTGADPSTLAAGRPWAFDGMLFIVLEHTFPCYGHSTRIALSTVVWYE